MNKPKYLLFLMIDSPDSLFNTGGMVAAPIAGEIVRQIAPILNVKPHFGGL